MYFLRLPSDLPMSMRSTRCAPGHRCICSTIPAAESSRLQVRPAPLHRCLPPPPSASLTEGAKRTESSCSGPSRTHQAWRSEGIACGCARLQAPPRNWCLSPMHSAPDAANSRLATAHVHARKRTRSCSRSRSSSVCVRTRAVCSLSVLSQTALACIASLSSTLSAPGADTGQRACAETRVRGVRGQRDERITTCAHEHTQSFGLT